MKTKLPEGGYRQTVPGAELKFEPCKGCLTLYYCSEVRILNWSISFCSCWLIDILGMSTGSLGVPSWVRMRDTVPLSNDRYHKIFGLDRKCRKKCRWANNFSSRVPLHDKTSSNTEIEGNVGWWVGWVSLFEKSPRSEQAATKIRFWQRNDNSMLCFGRTDGRRDNAPQAILCCMYSNPQSRVILT